MKTIARVFLVVATLAVAGLLLGSFASDGRVTMYGWLGSKAVPLELDDSTHAGKSIAYPHSEIHDGNSYVVEEGIQLNNASKVYLITAPNTTKWAHMTFYVDGAQDTSYTCAEGSTHTGGTAMAEINRNRNSANTAGVTITHTPAGAIGTPTTLFSSQFGIATAAGGRGGGGGEGANREEFILKQNENVVCTVTALSANANNITVVFDWYEHTDKD
jgi:hypothetical protein